LQSVSERKAGRESLTPIRPNRLGCVGSAKAMREPMILNPDASYRRPRGTIPIGSEEHQRDRRR
jgi:hypothetical protein